MAQRARAAAGLAGSHQRIEVTTERVVERVHERPCGQAPGGFLFGHLRLPPFCVLLCCAD